METGARFIDSQAKSFAQELNIDNRTEQIAKQQAFITLKDHANAIVTTESETAGMKYIGLAEGTEKNFQTARNCQSISGHSKTTTPILQLTGVF